MNDAMNSGATQPTTESTEAGKLANSVSNAISRGGQKLADALDHTSHTLREGAATVQEKSSATASRIEEGARLLRSSSSNVDIVRDCCNYIETYPYRATGLAAIVGFLLARRLYRG